MEEAKGRKRHLAPLVRLFWAAKGAAMILFLAAFMSFLLSSTKGDIFWIRNADIPAYIWGAAAVALAAYLFYIELKYRNYFYILGEEEIVIRSGVFNSERVLIPYIRIQNMNAIREVHQRILGTATIKIETAGGNPGEAEGYLPAVNDHEKLMAEISERMEAARKKAGPRGRF